MEDEAAREAEGLDLLPVGPLPRGTIEALAARLSRDVALPCRAQPPPPLPLLPLPGREQLDAFALLRELEGLTTRDRGRILVGVTARDVATPVFAFVFGLARPGGRAILVSLARLDPRFYGLAPDDDLRDARAAAEIRHELGHLAALEHCPDAGCLMGFAGSVEKADARGSRFCPVCTRRLPPWLRRAPY